MVFFRLTDLTTPRTRLHQDEDEVLEPRVFTTKDARLLVHNEDVMDMKTILGLSLVSEELD